jgi:dipeptidase
MMPSASWILLPIVLLLTCIASPVCACFAVIAGRGASADGSVLVGHNEENYGERVLNFRRIPRRKFDSGATVRLRRGGELPQVPETWALFWSENPGLEFSDAYMNEWGVAVVSDNCPTREDDCDTLVARGEIRDGGIGYMLRRLVALRARSAREGVQLAGSLVERFGYIQSGRTYVIADSREAWLMAVVAGRRWVAQRVPDDSVVILPNVHVIGEVNLDDADNFLASPDLVPYAVTRGWYHPQTDGPFNFRLVYQTPDRTAADDRQWRGQQLLTGADTAFSPTAVLPFCVRPKEKMTVASVAAILRDRTQTLSLFKTGTQETAVFQLRGDMPAAIGCVYWRTTARPDTSVLTPWYAGATDVPACYYRPVDVEKHFSLEHHFDPPPGTFDVDLSLAWWRFKTLQDTVDGDFAPRFGVVRSAWAGFEKRLFDRQAEIERQALDLRNTDANAAREFLTDYSGRVALEACEEAKQLTARIGQ